MFKIPYFTWTLPQHELVKANCAAAGLWRLLIEAALDKLAQVVSFRAPTAAETSDELLAVMIQGANNGAQATCKDQYDRVDGQRRIPAEISMS